MELQAADSTEEDIQARVLQNTIASVAASDDEGCCVICLDSIDEVCEARPCSHRHFDYLCLLSWLQQQTRCPLCKSDVREVRYDFRDGAEDEGYKVYAVPPPKHPVPRQHLQSEQVGTQQHDRGGSSHSVRPLGTQHLFRRRRVVSYQPPRPVTEDDALVQRRRVYREQLYSLHVGTSPRTGYRDLTPQAFESNPELVSRARKWLRRELQVFEFLRPDRTLGDATGFPSATHADTDTHTTVGRSTGDRLARRRANNAEFLLEYIVAILKTVDVRGSQGQAEEMLKDFLGRENTRLLLHELASFLRSPYSLETWDRKVQYPPSNGVKRRRTRTYDDTAESSQERDSDAGSGADGWGRGEGPRRRRRLATENLMDETPSTSVGGRVVDSYRSHHSRTYKRRWRTDHDHTDG